MAPSPANSHGNGYPLGLAGAVLATRFVGGTATVAPTTGTFLVGDFVIGRNGTLFVCTVAGSPGTWVQVGAGGSGTVTSVTATDASVVVTGTAADPTIATAALNTIAGLKAMSGALAMNAQKITGLADGTAEQDALALGEMKYWGAGQGYVTGQYYGAFFQSGAAGLLMTEARLCAIPIPVRKTFTADRISVFQTALGTAGAVGRLGIYSDNGSMYPGALLLDAGTFDASTGNNVAKEITISQALTRGLYWLVYASQGTPATPNQVYATTSGSYWPWLFGFTDLQATGAGFLQSAVSGALPANFTVTPAVGTSIPLIWLRST